MQTAIPAVVMRGGTSKGLYFHRRDLPADPATRDRVLLAAMGSPDDRQIDGMGGAHPLTSKVAVIAPSDEPGIDVDYLFLQVVVDRAIVSDEVSSTRVFTPPMTVFSSLDPAMNSQWYMCR